MGKIQEFPSSGLKHKTSRRGGFFPKEFAGLKLFVRFPTLLLVSASALLAQQQQTITVSKPLQPVTAPVTGELTEAQAGALVGTVLGAGQPAADRAYMIHVVKYLDSKVAVDKQNWYVYDRGEIGRPPIDYHAKERYKEARIFGRPKLGLVYLHILRGITLADAQTALRVEAQNRITSPPASFNDAQVEQDLTANLAVISMLRPNDAVVQGISASPRTGPQSRAAWLPVAREKFVLEMLMNSSSGSFALKSDRGQTLFTWNGFLIENPYADLAQSLTYTVLIKSKQPAPLVNLQQIVGLVFGAQAMPTDVKLTLTPHAFAAGEIVRNLLCAFRYYGDGRIYQQQQRHHAGESNVRQRRALLV